LKFKPGVRKTKISFEMYADYMHDIVQTLHEPLLVLDGDLRVRLANKSFYRTFRVRQGETENCLLQDLGKGQWKMPKLLELLKQALTRKAGFENFETQQLFPDIGMKSMVLDASQIYHQADATQTILLSIQDVTQQKEAERKLTELNRELKERSAALERSNGEIQALMKVKEDFTARVSHELRTPLTALKESINIVYEGASGVLEEQKMFLEMAKRNVERLSRLVDNVLDFSKLNSGQKKMTMTAGSLNNLIREGGAFYEPLAVRKGLKIRYELQPGIPEIPFDHDSILQVLTNLLSNAIKFTEQGEIVIRSKLGTHTVEVSVLDTGMGVDKKDIKKLFKPFEQFAGADAVKIKGTGLGLTISKQIIKQHDGNISIHSESGKGTLARFTLPLIPRKKPATEVSLVTT